MKHRSYSGEAVSPNGNGKAAVSAPEASGKERWTVDAIEDTPQGKVARIELPDGQTTDLKLTELPEGLQEGDLLQVEQSEGKLNITFLHEETRVAHKQAQLKLEALNAAGATSAEQEITL